MHTKDDNNNYKKLYILENKNKKIQRNNFIGITFLFFQLMNDKILTTNLILWMLI